MGFIVTMTIVVLAAVLMAFVMFMSYREQSRRQDGPLRRAERYELKSARATLDAISRLAAEYRVLDSSDLPYKINDLIDIHEKDTAK